MDWMIGACHRLLDLHRIIIYVFDIIFEWNTNINQYILKSNLSQTSIKSDFLQKFFLQNVIVFK